MMMQSQPPTPFLSGKTSYLLGGAFDIFLCWAFPGLGNIVVAFADPSRRIINIIIPIVLIAVMWLLYWTIIGYFVPLIASLIIGLVMILKADNWGNNLSGANMMAPTTVTVVTAPGASAPASGVPAGDEFAKKEENAP